MADKIFDLLKTSAVTQGIISITLLGIDSVLLLQGRVIPEWWIQLTIGVVFFFFGGKLGVEQGRNALLKEQSHGNS